MKLVEWQEAISKALEPGDVITPAGLLQTLTNEGEPRQALSNMDRSNRLFASLHKEFPFFRQPLPNEIPLSDEDQARGIGSPALVDRTTKGMVCSSRPRA